MKGTTERDNRKVTTEMVYIFLATGFEEIEALTAVDILRRGGVDARTVSITGERIVKGAHDSDNPPAAALRHNHGINVARSRFPAGNPYP